MDSFLHCNRPIITAMLKSRDTKSLIAEIERCLINGAEAFGLQIDMMEPQYRTRQDFTDIIQAMDGRPAYITDYSRGNVSPTPQSEEELAEELLMAFECGARLCDIRGDLFCPSAGEITEDDTAVEKQKRLIRHIHEMGGEVLMSSHVLKYIPKEETLRIALLHQERGADIAKIVTMAESEAELNENFETILLLKRKLKIPSLFLCNGSHCKKHRILGPLLGSCMFLTTENSRKPENQPLIDEARRILADAGYMN